MCVYPALEDTSCQLPRTFDYILSNCLRQSYQRSNFDLKMLNFIREIKSIIVIVQNLLWMLNLSRFVFGPSIGCVSEVRVVVGFLSVQLDGSSLTPPPPHPGLYPATLIKLFARRCLRASKWEATLLEYFEQ